MNAFKKMSQAFLLLILLVVSGLGEARPFYYWYISIQGQTLNKSFQRDGWLYAIVPGLNDPKSTSGKNPVDVVVSSGNPSGMQNPSSYPPTGSFEFATDAIWYGKPYVDLAYVSIDQNCIVLQPDMNRLTYAEKQVINTFSGLGATHVIYEGYIKICSNDGFNTVNGYIDMNGYNAMTPYTQTTKTARYTASFQGRMYGSAELGL